MIRLGILGSDEALRAALAPHLPSCTLVPEPAAGDIVLNPDRYLPSRQLIHREIAAGKLGEPGLVRIHRWEPRSSRAGSSSDLPGPLLRDLDLALWLIGQSPNLVYAVETSGETQPPSVGRFIQVHLGFLGNRMALVDYCNRLPPGDGYASLSVIGSAGAAYADDHQNMQLQFRGGRPQAVRTEEGTGYLRKMMQELATLCGPTVPVGLDSHDTVNSQFTSDRDVRTTLAVASAVAKSLATRQAVSLEGR